MARWPLSLVLLCALAGPASAQEAPASAPAGTQPASAPASAPTAVIAQGQPAAPEEGAAALPGEPASAPAGIAEAPAELAAKPVEPPTDRWGAPTQPGSAAALSGL